jgi:hypothetical protein
MKKLVFISLAVLGFIGVNETVWGMPNPSDNREDSNESSDQIRMQDFDKPREEIDGRPTCIGGRRDEYEDLFGKFEDEMLYLIKQAESSVREIVKLQKENWILRRVNKHPDDNLEWSQYSASQETDAMRTFIETIQGAVDVFSTCIAEFSRKQENLKKENEALKKGKASTSEKDEQ